MENQTQNNINHTENDLGEQIAENVQVVEKPKLKAPVIVWTVIGAVVALALIIALLVVHANDPKVINQNRMNTLSAAEYLSVCEKENFEKKLDRLAELYNKAGSEIGFYNAGNRAFEFEALAKGDSTTYLDIEGLVNIKDNKGSIEAKGYAGTDVNIRAAYDFDKQDIYVTSADGEIFRSNVGEVLDEYNIDFDKIFPKDQTKMNEEYLEILRGYVTFVADYLGKFEESEYDGTDTVKIGKLRQEQNVVVTEISVGEFEDFLNDFLDYASDDDQLFEYLDKYGADSDDYSYIIEEAQRNLNRYGISENKNQKLLDLYSFFNDKGELCGHKADIKVPDSSTAVTVLFQSIQTDTEFGAVFEVEENGTVYYGGELSLSREGKIVNGSFSLTDRSGTGITGKIKDLEIVNLEKLCFNGKISVDYTSYYGNSGVDIKLAYEEKRQSIDVNFDGGKIKLEYADVAPADVKLPNSGDIDGELIDFYNLNDVMNVFVE